MFKRAANGTWVFWNSPYFAKFWYEGDNFPSLAEVAGTRQALVTSFQICSYNKLVEDMQWDSFSAPGSLLSKQTGTRTFAT